jgi:hypothetical protein
MLTDRAAAELVRGLRIPAGIDVRLRTRNEAGGFTVVRADGQIWRNTASALAIHPSRMLEQPGDLALSVPDGSA